MRRGFVVLTVFVLLGLTAPPASATHLESGDGVCVGVDFCEFKGDSQTGCVADWWSGFTTHTSYYNDWHYACSTSDSPNDDMEYVRNRDSVAWIVYEDPHPDHSPSSCFPAGYNSSDTLGRENNGSHNIRTGSSIC